MSSGNTNPGVTWKPDNPLKEIWNLVSNITGDQWPNGLAVPTKI